MTFDRSVADFVIEIAHEMGLKECSECKTKITKENIGGIINRNGKPILICKNMLCLMEVARFQK